MSSTTTTPVIQATDLEKTFRDLRAVNGLSFTVQSGECFGLLGPNGAGKTTTIRMLYGFSRPSGGKLTVFDRDVTTELRAIKQRLGICQQEDNLDPDLTVRQNLQVYARYFNIPSSEAAPRIDRLLSFVRLDNRQEARIIELSGGMKRRLILARALLNNPELLILDEPTTGLDPQSRQQIWQRLAELKAEGMTILLTTHYMEEAAQLCDRLIIVDNGQILVEGSPQALINEHAGRELLEVRQPDQDVRRWLQNRGVSLEDLGYRLLVTGEAAHHTYHDLRQTYPEVAADLRMGNLEDVFLRLTGKDLRE